MLVSRELQERRGQAALCLAWIPIGAVLGSVHGGQDPGRWTACFGAIALFYALFMPLFVAMRTALGETTDGTRAFSAGLPISSRLRGAVRLAGGAVVVAAPILLGAGLLSAGLAVAMPQDGGPNLWFIGVAIAWFAQGLYLLLCLLGTGLRREAHLGYWGPPVIVTIMMLTDLQGRHPWLANALSWFMRPGDQSPRYAAGDLPGPLVLSVAVQGTLAVLFVLRYGRSAAPRPIEWTRPAWWHVNWAPRLSTPGLALAWHALRQAVPLCLPGLFLAGLMAVIDVDFGWHYPQSLVEQYRQRLPLSMEAAGLLWGVVVAAGIFAPEIDSRIGEFWRSRPISPFRLFAVKFVLGLLVVLLVLDGSAIALSWSARSAPGIRPMGWAYVACIPLLHGLMFALAAASTCLLRHAAWGAGASLATFGLGEALLRLSNASDAYEPTQVFRRLAEESQRTGQLPNLAAWGDPANFHYPAVTAAMVAIVATAFLAGWHWFRRYQPGLAIGRLKA